MKIIVLPGVGFNKSTEVYNAFANKVSKGLNCECSVHYWEHDWNIPDLSLPYDNFRDYVAEVILDFQQVVRHAFDMNIPEADYYIGHSAGSILSLVQLKPCIIFGSPAALVEVVNEKNDTDVRIKSSTDSIPILNIINKYDLLSYPLNWDNVNNVYLSGSVFSPTTYFPLSAHIFYWRSDKVIYEIVNAIEKWEAEK